MRLVVLLLAVAVAPCADFTILTTSPPELVSVDASSWKVASRARLDAVPATAAVSPNGNFLYVLIDGGTNIDGTLPKGPGTLVVFSLRDRKIVASYPVGWAATSLALTSDGRFIACFRGRSPARVFERAPSVASGIRGLVSAGKIGRRPSTITLIDTTTHQLAWQRELGEADGNVLFSSATGLFYAPESKGHIRIIDLEGKIRIVELPFGKGKRETAMSPDGRWAYVIEDGKDAMEKAERFNGRIFVVDGPNALLAQTFETETDELAPAEGPSARGIAIANRSGLIRAFAGSQLLWSYKTKKLRFTRRMDKPAGFLIVEADRVAFFDNERASAPTWLLNVDFDGYPGSTMVRGANSETLALPVITSNHGLDLDRVLLLNLAQRTVSSSIPVGRRGRMKTKSILSDVAMGAISGLGGTGWDDLATDVINMVGDGLADRMTTANPLLKVAPDGQFVYGMSRYGGDVTIIRASNASIVTIIPSGGESSGLILSAGGLLCAWAGKQLTWIDTTNHTVKATHRASRGRFERIQPPGPGRDWLTTFGKDHIMVWNTATGDPAATIEGLGKPRLVVSAPQ